ncbi:unnamed protein product [Musa banksii]
MPAPFSFCSSTRIRNHFSPPVSFHLYACTASIHFTVPYQQYMMMMYAQAYVYLMWTKSSEQGTREQRKGSLSLSLSPWWIDLIEMEGPNLESSALTTAC